MKKSVYGALFAVQTDRDFIQRKLTNLQHHLQDVMLDLKAIGLETDDLKAIAKNSRQLSERSEITYQNIIAVLVNLLLDHSSAGKPLSVFKNQAAIVDAIIARHKDAPGLSRRALDEKLTTANRSLKKTNNLSHCIAMYPIAVQ